MIQRLLLYILLFCISINVFAQNNNNTATDTIIESYKLNIGYVNSLSNKSEFYFKIGDYNKSIDIGEERLRILEELQWKDSLRYALCQADLALSYANVRKLDKAISLAIDAVKLMEKYNTDISIEAKIETENKLSTYYSLVGDYKNALHRAKNVMHVCLNLYGKNDERYINSKSEVATILSRMSINDEAIIIQEEVLEFRKNHGDTLRYAFALHDLSMQYAKRGNYNKAIAQCKEASLILKRYLGEADELYRQSIISLADYYTESGDSINAINICKELSHICLNCFGSLSSEYAKALSIYAFKEYKLGNYLKAIDLEKKSLVIQDSLTYKDEIEYSISLSNIAIFNQKLGNLKEAIAYNMQALTFIQKYPHTRTYREVNANLSMCFLEMGSYEKARYHIAQIYSEIDKDREKDLYYKYLQYVAIYYDQTNNDSCIAIWEKICDYERINYGEVHARYSSSLGNLSSCYLKFGKLRDAIYTQEKSLAIKKQLYGEKSVHYAKSMSFLAYMYIMIGDKEKATNYINTALSTTKSILGIENIEYVNMLRTLARLFLNTPQEIELLEEANKILTKLKGNVATYIKNSSSLAKAYALQKRHDDFTEIVKTLETQEAVLNYFQNNQKSYINFLEDVSIGYNFLGKNDKAISYAQRALKIANLEYGKNIEKYQSTISTLLSCNFLNKNIKSIIELIKEYDYFNVVKKDVITELQSLTSNYRSNIWREYSPFFIDAIPIIALASKDDYIVSQAYDISALFSKGLLLKLETEVPDLIKNYGDSALSKKYNLYLSNLQKKDIAKSSYVIDSLRNVLTKQEDEIRQALGEMGVFKNFNISWKNIRDELSENEIAIEFLTCQPDSSIQLNAALILKKNYSFPKLVVLASTSQLNDFISKKQADSLYNNIWSPIEEELKDVKNIYFSPSGIFNIIPIEYLPNKNNQNMYEQYNIYRLSSTREILNKSRAKVKKEVVLFGGLNYDKDLGTDIMSNDVSTIPIARIDRGLRDSLVIRGALSPFLIQ